MSPSFDLDFVAGANHGSIEFDSVPDPDFPEWTRAHIDVVLPDVITNLGWTVVGPVFEQTRRKMVSRRLAVMPRSKTTRWRHTARIGGYACINVSSSR